MRKEGGGGERGWEGRGVVEEGRERGEKGAGERRTAGGERCVETGRGGRKHCVRGKMGSKVLGEAGRRWSEGRKEV